MYSKGTLLQIDPHVVISELLENLGEIGAMITLNCGHSKYVIYINFKILPNLIFKNLVHGTMVGCSYIL